MFMTRALGPSHNLHPFAMLDEFLSPGRARLQGAVLPLDLWEEGDALHVELELPGVQEEELELNVFERQLQIRVRPAVHDRAESGSEPAAPERRYLARERQPVERERLLRLPYEVDADRVDARLENGLLHITMPKSERLLPRRIELKK